MPKVFIRGEHQPIEVNKEDAERILEQKNDPKYRGMIDIGLRKVQKGQIKEVSFAASGGGRAYNLADPDVHKKILEFERMIESLKTETQPLREREYYGYLIPKHPGYVINEILGGVHWTTVEYAINRGYIIRKEGQNKAYWSIGNKGTSRNVDISEYMDFKNKLKALDELRERRNYAHQKENESIAKEVDSEVKKLEQKGFFDD